MADVKKEVRAVEPGQFKEAMARWASTVTVVAVRDEGDGRVRATTATSFAPVSSEPAEVVVSLSPSAQVIPFLEQGGAFGISFLSEAQRRWAAVFADSFPAGPMPWPEEGIPLISESVATLACVVRKIHVTEGRSHLVVARVTEISLGVSSGPLLYWGRAYRRISDEEL